MAARYDLRDEGEDDAKTNHILGHSSSDAEALLLLACSGQGAGSI